MDQKFATIAIRQFKVVINASETRANAACVIALSISTQEQTEQWPHVVHVWTQTYIRMT